MTCIRLISLLLAAFAVNHLVAFGQADPIPGNWDKTDTFSVIETLEDKALDLYLRKFNYRTIGDVPDKIVGGVDAAEGEAPFQAQLFRKDWFGSGTKFHCGGSLISTRTVLTAGHCVN